MKKYIFIVFLSAFLFSSLSVFSQTPQISWWYDIKDEAFGQSAMADLDMDGKPEIVFSAYRNDSCVYVLNAENGSLLWKVNIGGCNDVAPLIYDVDHDDTLDIVLASSCVPKTFCFNGMTGVEKWQCPTRGSDSPPTVADIDNDGQDEILHGEFQGYVICINAVSGIEEWELDVDGGNSWVQTAPAILDLNGDNQLDFVVGTWSFNDSNKVYAYDGNTRQLLWKNSLPQDYIYHGCSYADLDEDGKPELAIGCYDGSLYVLNGEDGSLYWRYDFPSYTYIGAPTSIADVNNDDSLEIIVFAYDIFACFSPTGRKIWERQVPNYASSFRGAAIADVNEDDTLDYVFGASDGVVYAHSGASGRLLWTVDLRADHDSSDFDIDHAPVIDDFDNDGDLDVFIVGGKTYYPNIEFDYGRAYAIDLGQGITSDWKMFRHDRYRSGCLCENDFAAIQDITEDDAILKTYPNPATSILNIEFENKRRENLSLSTYNINGELLSLKNIGNNLFINDQINIEAYTRGLYIIRIYGQKTNYYGKFIVLGD
jgi:outer membrane protein assembly factor BamB